MPLIPSRSENSRGEQSRLTTPTMSVAQHKGLEAVSELHRRARLLSKVGTAIASATLAATVVIMMNRILIRSSWLSVKF